MATTYDHCINSPCVIVHEERIRMTSILKLKSNKMHQNVGGGGGGGGGHTKSNFFNSLADSNSRPNPAVTDNCKV